MKVWYAAAGFEDEFDDEDANDAPWDFGIDWDEVNLFVTLDDKKPKLNDEVVVIGYSFDGVVNAPYGLREWPLDKLGDNFFRRVIDLTFESIYARKILGEQ